MKKTKIAVTAEGYLRGECKCGWRGLCFSQKTDLSAAIVAASDEVSQHKCPPKVKKKKAVKK